MTPFIVIFLVFYAIIAFPLGFIFSKMGEDKVAAWIPFYNIWLAFSLGNVAPILSITFYTPLIALGAAILGSGIGLSGASLGVTIYVVALVSILAFWVLSSIAAYRISESITGNGIWVIAYVAFPLVWLYLIAFIKFDAQKLNPFAPQNQGYSSPQQYPANPGPYSSQPYPPTSSAPSGYTPQAQPNYTPPPTLGGNDNGGWGLVNGGNNDDNPYIK